MAVFGEDLFALEKTDPRRILRAPVVMTIAGGRVVYEAPAPR
jgi:predicted amidohydrolase YtcJ